MTKEKEFNKLLTPEIIKLAWDTWEFKETWKLIQKKKKCSIKMEDIKNGRTRET